MDGQQVRGSQEGLGSADVSQLRNQLEKVRKQNSMLRIGVIGLFALVLLIGYLIFYWHVGRYAVIDDLQITQDATTRKKVYFRWHVKEGGLIRRGYEGATAEDVVIAGKKDSYEWGWFVAPSQKEFTVYLRSRSGIFPTWTTKVFSLSPGM